MNSRLTAEFWADIPLIVGAVAVVAGGLYYYNSPKAQAKVSELENKAERKASELSSSAKESAQQIKGDVRNLGEVSSGSYHLTKVEF